MAYQNVGRPRFFIDNYQYLRALGLDPLSYLENEQNDYEDMSLNYQSKLL